MKYLFLLRHAQATNSTPDFDRVLTDQGIEKCKKVAKILEDYAEKIDFILCSSSARTSQTIRSVLPANPVHYSKNYYNSSPEKLLEYLQETDKNHQTIMLVNHNPSISLLASDLAGDIIELLPGSLVLLECDIDSWEDLASHKAKLVSFWQ